MAVDHIITECNRLNWPNFFALTYVIIIILKKNNNTIICTYYSYIIIYDCLYLYKFTFVFMFNSLFS